MSKATILAVDDEAFNLDILTELLEDDGYAVTGACDGEEAWDLLQSGFLPDVIVLDRMMPRLDGMGLLARLKADGRWRNIPVIMQTAAASHDQIRQGIEAGVFYYLTKPYEEKVLLSLVRAAHEEGLQRQTLTEEVQRQQRIPGLTQEARFRFRSLDDAHALAVFICNAFPEPERVAYGLHELMINAVEHGNLGITYAEKTALVQAGSWHQEIESRLQQADYADRFATLVFSANDSEFKATISDRGAGFDWRAYLELSPDRATDPHGRGVATSRLISFDSLAYNETGNEVTACVKIAKASL